MLQDSLGNTTDTRENTSAKTRTSINDLPIEIIIRIFANVSPMDLKDLRLVCRKWNSAVLDKGTWTKAFDNRLCTGKVFASATRSNVWILEYFGRMANYRRWAKAKAYSRLYQLVNDLTGRVSQVEADFGEDRLLTFSQFSGTISLCTLTLGKSQVFIPENTLFGEIIAFDVTLSYTCIASAGGGLFLKNLMTATASGSNQSSVKRLSQSETPVCAVKLNRHTDKHKEKCDIVSMTLTGVVSLWNLGGKIVASVDIKSAAVDLRTDFKTVVVVVSQISVHIIDFTKATVLCSFEHGWQFDCMPTVFEVDFHDNNIVVSHENQFRVFHYKGNQCKILEGSIPEDTWVLNGCLQDSQFPRNRDLPGSDGLLVALTFSDGSMGVFNVRDLEGTIPYKTRIMPFKDDRTPQGITLYTKVAINSTVVAIGALPDWVHFYDAHSGKYLREGTKVSRKFIRNGAMPILKIQLAPNGSCGVIVSDNAIQYFRYGDEILPKKKPNAPQAADLKNRRAVNQHIKSQMAEYNEQQHQRLQEDQLADKYNGVSFDDEQDELSVALALSMSCARDVGGIEHFEHEDEIATALKLLREEAGVNLCNEEEQIRTALALSEATNSPILCGQCQSYGEGLSRDLFRNAQDLRSQTDLFDQDLEKILELSRLEQ